MYDLPFLFSVTYIYISESVRFIQGPQGEELPDVHVHVYFILLYKQLTGS